MSGPANTYNHAARIPSLLNATLLELSDALDAQAFTSADLVRAYLLRIAEVNDYFHAVMEVNPDALSIAKSLDDEQRKNGRRGRLHGIPILLKDNMATLDSMETTAGSACLIGARPSEEARLVQKLRRAGGVILGKTNLSEWAGFRTSNGISGWTPRGGMTMGAYCENMKCSGSSSGAAVASALGLAAATIGSETDGSIVSPVGRHAVVGLKPTVGLISTKGMLPLATTQDTPGPITKSVQDTAYLLDILAEQDAAEGPTSEYIASCKTIDIKGLRIGVPSASFPPDDVVVLNQFEDAMRTLENAGATIIRDANFAAAEEYNSLTKSQQLYVLAGSFQQDIKTYLKSLATNPRNIHDLRDLIRLTKEIPEEEYPVRGTEQLELAESIDVNGPEFKAAVEKNKYLAGKGGILGTIEEHNLDVIAAPAMCGPAVTFAARGGLPVIVMPLGAYPDGTELKYYRNGPVETIDVGPNVPFGITFCGGAYSERTLLRVAYALEQLTSDEKKIQPFRLPQTELPGYAPSHAELSKV